MDRLQHSSTNIASQWIRIAVVAAVSVAAVGCGTSSVMVPASELPSVSNQLDDERSRYMLVRTVEGRDTRIGKHLKAVDVHVGSKVETYDRSFRATFAGREIIVRDRFRQGHYLRANDLEASLRFRRGGPRQFKAGIVLTAVGAPLLAGSAALFISTAIKPDVDFDLRPLGGALIGIFGLGTLIPGVILLATTESESDDTARIFEKPTLRVGPGGVDLTAHF